MAILVLHGPNLNLLGTREPEVYGAETLDEINHRLQSEAERAGAKLTCLQSNGEQELIEAVHQAQADAVHYYQSRCVHAYQCRAARCPRCSRYPVYEVHISNVYAREPFRHHSYISDIAEAVISGLGSFGYDCALAAVLQSQDTHSTKH